MILADKIIDLRKKNGWSQEDLAEKLDVSRQSISKWESAQAVPDMNKILKLSEIFGVSTDYLLKDEIEPENTQADGYDNTDTFMPLRKVSMEEAGRFLDFRNSFASAIALGVMMCIFSPILIVLLNCAVQAGRLSITEGAANGIGLIVLFLLIGGAVALFVINGIKNSPYEYLDNEMIETEYGVDGMARERRDRFKGTFTAQLTTGIVLCVMSAVPVFVVMAVSGEKENTFYYGVAVAVLLAFVGIGSFLIIRSSIIWGSLQMILEEGSYSRANKEENAKNGNIAGIYWALVTAGYLAYSFLTMKWDRSWIIWPIAGVLYGAIVTILRAVRSKA